MPELFLKSDPSQKRYVSQEVANSLYATGEWEFAPGQQLFLMDSRGETFAVDASQADMYLGGERLEPGDIGLETTQNIARRAQRRQDVEEYSEGLSNNLLMGAEAVGRGLSLGTSDLLFGGEGAAIRREEAGGIGTALEIGGAILPALFTGGAGAGVTGARLAGGRALAGRVLARTPAGLAMKAGEAARLATGARLAGAARIGALGSAARAVAPAIAQGVTEGALYGAGEGVSQLALSDDPVTSEAIFSSVGGGALHGAAFGGTILGAAVGAGKILKGVQGRVQKRLNTALNSEARRELANRIASGADEEINAFRRELAATDDAERLSLLEKEATSKKVYEEVARLRRMGERGREKTLRETFEAERKSAAARAEGDLAALGKVDANQRRIARQSFGHKAIKDNPELMAQGRQFAGELKDVYGSLGHANRLIREASDVTGRVLPLRQWQGTYKRFKEVFAPGGKLIQDPEKLARTLTKAGNRELLGKVEQSVVDIYGDLSGRPVAFDDFLANWKVTDEFIKASELGLNQEAQGALQKDMFDKHMGFLDRERKAAQQEIMRAGEDAYQDIVLREQAAVDRIRSDTRLADAIDRTELDKLSDQVQQLGKKKMPKRLENEIMARADKVAELAADAGLNLSPTDKVAIAASIGLELDVIPSGTALDRIIQLFAVAKLARGRGPSDLVALVAGKTPGLSKLAHAAMHDVAGVGLQAASGKVRQSAVKRTLGEAVMDIGAAASKGVLRRMKQAEVSMLRSMDKNIDRFLKGGAKGRKVVVPTALKILNATSFAGEPGRQTQYKTSADAFMAKSEELSQAVANPQGLQDSISERLGIIDFQDPLLSNQLMGLALKRIQFLYDKMPKNPGLGAFGMQDRWRPSDSDIARWSRFIAGTDDPNRTIEDMNSGRLSYEQAEALRVIYPEIFQKTQLQFFEKIGEKGNTTYEQRNQLSILFGSPVDFSQRPEFLLAMQANFLPTQPTPASQVHPGRLTTEAIEPPTPAQRTLER